MESNFQDNKYKHKHTSHLHKHLQFNHLEDQERIKTDLCSIIRMIHCINLHFHRHKLVSHIRCIIIQLYLRFNNHNNSNNNNNNKYHQFLLQLTRKTSFSHQQRCNSNPYQQQASSVFHYSYICLFMYTIPIMSTL